MQPIPIVVVPEALGEKLGDEGSKALVELLKSVQREAKEDAITLVEERFARRLAEELGKLRKEIYGELNKIWAEMGRIWEEIGNLRAEFYSEMGKLRAELTEKIEQTKADLYTEINSLRTGYGETADGDP